ncbi:ATP-binding protein [Streptomyces sp. SCSIO 30461]|uniref:ATP-binding protein n=1 Tax=Streptomyces sp. SCSIO 30461 TaxID=3118085 RepID=UPI0030CB4BBE
MTKTDSTACAPFPSSQRYSFTGPNAAMTVRLARDWVACLMEAHGRPRLVEAAKLCTSEAVTNTYLHTCASVIAVDVSVTDARVLVLVKDDEAGKLLPTELTEVPVTRQGGRGLLLIAAYAERWNVVQGGGRHKTVWFSLTEQTEEPVEA